MGPTEHHIWAQGKAYPMRNPLQALSEAEGLWVCAWARDSVAIPASIGLVFFGADRRAAQAQENIFR